MALLTTHAAAEHNSSGLQLLSVQKARRPVVDVPLTPEVPSFSLASIAVAVYVLSRALRERKHQFISHFLRN